MPKCSECDLDRYGTSVTSEQLHIGGSNSYIVGCCTDPLMMGTNTLGKIKDFAGRIQQPEPFVRKKGIF